MRKFSGDLEKSWGGGLGVGEKRQNIGEKKSNGLKCELLIHPANQAKHDLISILS